MLCFLDAKRGKNGKVSKIIKVIVKEVMMMSPKLKGSSQERFMRKYIRDYCVRPIFFHTLMDEVLFFLTHERDQ